MPTPKQVLKEYGSTSDGPTRDILNVAHPE